MFRHVFRFPGNKNTKKRGRGDNMKKYTIKNERITLIETVMPSINFKIYALAGTAVVLFIGGIRLICELLVMIQAA